MSQVHDHDNEVFSAMLVSVIITYISIDGRQELVGVLVVVLTGVGHYSVKHRLLFLLFPLGLVLTGCLLYQINLRHLVKC